MAKRCSASVVTIVLLGCLLGIQIEAQQGQTQGSVKVFFPSQQTKPLQKTPQVQLPIPGPKGVNPVPINRCDVTDNVRVLCGPPFISPEECQALECCFDGFRCYYGRAVTLQCTKTGEFIVVVAKDVTVPSLDVESILLLEQGQQCSQIDSNSGFAIYQFPVSSCGTIVMSDSTSIIYENKLISSYEVGISQLGAVTRDSQFELIVQCRYIGDVVVKAVVFDDISASLQVDWQINATGPVFMEMMVANGACTTKGCNDFEVAYTSFHQTYPVTVALREPVFVAIQLMGTHTNVHLTLGRCWATYSSSPHSLPQWDILINGCPNEDDRYMTKLIRVSENSGLNPNHQKRFMFQMFTFVNPETLNYMGEEMYLHCSAYLCFPTQGQSCEPYCSGNSYRNRRNAPPLTQKNKISRVASVGPLIFHADRQ